MRTHRQQREVWIEIPPLAADRRPLAFDRRTVDADGRMSVTNCKLTKAVVNEYLGSEIPAPNLDPNRIYRMYRDPQALREAVNKGLFENQPLMSTHIAVSSLDPQKFYTVGSVSNATWKDNAVYADLMIWDQEAIDRVKDGSQKEISVGYRYTAIMKPGTVDGEHFSGRMAGPIEPNHISLVSTARVGPDCVVADSAMPVFANDTAGTLKRIEYQERQARERDPISKLIPGYFRL